MMDLVNDLFVGILRQAILVYERRKPFIDFLKDTRVVPNFVGASLVSTSLVPMEAPSSKIFDLDDDEV